MARQGEVGRCCAGWFRSYRIVFNPESQVIFLDRKAILMENLENLILACIYSTDETNRPGRMPGGKARRGLPLWCGMDRA
jgi:hypothetical protein